MKRRIAFGAVLVTVVAFAAAMYAFAAPRAGAARTATAAAGGQSINITVSGQKQGAFNKGVPIPLLAVSHEIVVPRDPSSGLPTGQRQHMPISVTMPWGPTTPNFLNALSNNENLTSVLIGLQRGGKTVATIKLLNANISRFVQTGQNVQFEMTYQRITWTWTSTGLYAQDDW